MRDFFSCKRCGNCCHGETTVSLDSADQSRMLEFLGITMEAALEKYLVKRDGQVQMKCVNGHCVFYNNGCSVHAARPKRCREWPLVKAIVKDRNNLLAISKSCPGLNGESDYEKLCGIIENGGLLAPEIAEDGQTK